MKKLSTKVLNLCRKLFQNLIYVNLWYKLLTVKQYTITVFNQPIKNIYKI